jgi:hypothetical protein
MLRHMTVRKAGKTLGEEARELGTSWSAAAFIPRSFRTAWDCFLANRTNTMFATGVFASIKHGAEFEPEPGLAFRPIKITTWRTIMKLAYELREKLTQLNIPVSEIGSHRNRNFHNRCSGC